jgi:hypothetical protein
MKRLVAILGIACSASAHGAEAPDAQNVLSRFRSIRPQAADLALYQLDWAPSLQAAKEKAVESGRPIFLVLVTNSFGDLHSGHC